MRKCTIVILYINKAYQFYFLAEEFSSSLDL